MKYYKLNNGLEISAISYGCMRYWGKGSHEMEEVISEALNLGINFFDLASIYGEDNFGKVLKRHPEWRKQMIIQSKCGIYQGYYDLSYEAIMESVKTSLEKLNTDYLDILLLHRPDALMDPREIAKAFDELHAAGKVKYFGVSNMNPGQIALIQKECHQPLLFNQLQFNVVNAGMIDEGINVNMTNPRAINRDGGVLNYCRLNNINIQAWSVLQASWQEGTYLNNEKYPKLNEVLNRLAEKYKVEPATIAISWILKHPANIQAIVGTTNIEHLKSLVKATSFELTRQEWYELYLSVDRMLP